MFITEYQKDVQFLLFLIQLHLVKMEILLLNWLTFAVALSAFTYSVILTEQGQILYPVSLFLEDHLPEWLYKPLIGCQYCVSGQWALWFYFYITLCQNEVNYLIWLHLWFICQTIFITKIITYFY